MSSEAAQKAYPLDNHIAEMQRQAFDKGAQWGAVEALRQFEEWARTTKGPGHLADAWASWVKAFADNWAKVAGQ